MGVEGAFLEREGIIKSSKNMRERSITKRFWKPVRIAGII